ncbi:hypothetical protein ACFOSE_03295 [Streptococcus dentapri]|uniref:Uncharacterized protein n=1 Tax=Streptococcus dentapri TaxID=573564 RepID=A0ABV8D051_9STRE
MARSKTKSKALWMGLGSSIGIIVLILGISVAPLAKNGNGLGKSSAQHSKLLYWVNTAIPCRERRLRIFISRLRKI